MPKTVVINEWRKTFTIQIFNCVKNGQRPLGLDVDCQFMTRVSANLRQAIDIRLAHFIGQKVIIAGTETAMIRISNGKPIRQ